MVLGQPRARRRPAPRPATGVAPGNAATATVVPYDYAASFRLTGRPGNLIQDVINIGAEGVFVAMAIGYGFQEDRGQPLVVSGLPEPERVTLGQIPVDALLTGFRVNPRFEALVFKTDDSLGPGTGRPQRLSDQPVPAPLQEKIFQRVKPPEEISFLLSMVDTSTGRELQDEPTHNLASLGKSNGERPFRMLAHPLTFMPRSTLRLQISER